MTDRLDKIFDKYATPPEPQEEPKPAPRELFVCEQEQYDVVFDPNTETAFFQFSEGELKRHLSVEERDYFVRTEYWRPKDAEA